MTPENAPENAAEAFAWDSDDLARGFRDRLMVGEAHLKNDGWLWHVRPAP